MNDNLTLPHYFDYFPSIIPPDIIDVLITVEQAFNLINYEGHHDDIDFIFTDGSDKSGKDLYDVTLAYYREHINSVLTLQGISLANPYTDPIIPITKILHCVSILAVTPVSEVLEGDNVDIENSIDAYFARVISLMSDLTTIQVLSYIQSVTPELIDYLHQDLPLEPLMTHAIVTAEQRFKNSPIEKKGIIVEAIRLLNRFGYNVHTFLTTHAKLIADEKAREDAMDYQGIANEVILMVLGSSTPDTLLLPTMLESVEHICDSSLSVLKVNTIITKYMESNHA